MYPQQGATEASISELPKGTARNLQARPLLPAKGPGKGWPKSRKSFWQYPPYSSQMPTEKPYYSFPTVSVYQRGADVSFYLSAPSLWKQILCTNFPLAEWSRDLLIHSLLGRSRWQYSTSLTRWYWWTEWAGSWSSIPHPVEPGRTLVLPPDWCHWSYCWGEPPPCMASVTLNKMVQVEGSKDFILPYSPPHVSGTHQGAEPLPHSAATKYESVLCLPLLDGSRAQVGT